MPLQVGELFVKLNLDTSNFSKLLDKAQQELRSLAKNNLNLKAKIDIDSSKISGAKSSLSGLTSSLTQVQDQARNTGRSFFDLGEIIRGALSYTVGIGITNAIRDLIHGIGSVIPLAANFEHQMSGVKAVLQASGPEFDALREKALQLGKDTQFSATEAAAGIEMLAKNGLTSTQILNGAIDASLALAAATGTDLSTAADVATDALLQFGLTTDQLPHAVNLITGAVNTSKFSIDDFRLAMGQAGGVASIYRVTLEDFNTVITATANKFNSGSDAGTSYRTFLLRLVGTTDKSKEAMRQLGIITEDGSNRFFDAQGNLKSMAEVHDVLLDTIGRLNPELQAEFGNIIFGQDAIRTMNGLLETTPERFREIGVALNETDAAEQAIIRIDNLRGLMEILASSFETVAIRIGDSLTPQLKDLVRYLIDVVNTSETIVQALQGSQEAFNNLSPALQVVVYAIQEAMGYFQSLAGMASEWGANIGSSFASGIIDAASAVINALMEMGSWIEYWLSPGSPPKIVPDLDKWGTEVAQVYFDAFSDASFSGAAKSMKTMITKGLQFDESDFKSLKNVSSLIKDMVSSVASSDNSGKSQVLDAVLGTREAWSKAIVEIKRFGGVSYDTFTSITKSAGSAGKGLEKIIGLYIEQIKISEELERAQNALLRAQKKLNDAELAKEAAISPIKAKLEELRSRQKILDIDQEIAEQTKLANAIGGDGTVQAKARAKLEELALEKQLEITEQRYDAQIELAKKDVDSAKTIVDTVKDREEAVKAQIALEEARLDSIADQNSLLKEQLEIIKKMSEESGKGKGGGGGAKSKAKTDAEKAAEAQEKYNLSIADTDGKLAILRAKLSTVEEGSVEYYDILEDIHKLEETQGKERAKAADLEEKEKQKQIKAQQDYEYSIASTAGKLDILHKRLGEVQEGSAEYYDILKEINQVEEQQKREQEQAAKEKARGSRGGGSGVPGFDEGDMGPKGTGTTSPLVKTAEDVKKAFEEAKKKMEEARVTAEKFKENIGTAAGKVREFITPVQELASKFKDLLIPALAALATPAVLGALTTIGTMLLGLLSPVMLISLAVGALVLAWQTNFMNIQGYTAAAWSQIQAIFSEIATILQGFWDEHGSEFVAKLQEIWGKVKEVFGKIFLAIFGELNTSRQDIQVYADNIKNILYGAWVIISESISGVLDIIMGIIDIFIGSATGNWDKAWQGFREIASGLLTIISGIIKGGLEIIAGFWGKNTEDILKLWDSFWKDVINYVMTETENIADSLRTWGENTDKWANDYIAEQKKRWSDYWGAIAKEAREWLDTAAKWIKEKLEIAKSTMNEIVGEMKRRYIDSMIEVANNTLTYMSNAARYAYDKVSELKSNVLGIISSLVTEWGTELSTLGETLKTNIDNAKNKILEVKDDFLSAAADIGKAIITGMIQGVVNNVQDAIDAVKDAVSDMIAGGNDKAKIKSPSRVFMEMGANMAQGLALGVSQYADMAERAAVDMTASAITGSAAMIPQGSANNTTTTGTTYYFNIDARGSDISETRFRSIIREEVNIMSNNASNRRRS